MDGVGVIQIEFHWHTDPDEKYDEVVREVNRIRRELPDGPRLARDTQGRLRTRQHRAAGARQRERQLPRARGARRGPEAIPSRRRRACAAARPGPYPQPEVRIAVDLERMGRAGVTLRARSKPRYAARTPRSRAAQSTSGCASSTSRPRAATSRSTRSSRPSSRAAVAGSSWCATSRTSSWDTSEESYIGRYNGRRAVFVTANAKDHVDVFAVRDAIYERVDGVRARAPRRRRRSSAASTRRATSSIGLSTPRPRLRDRHRASCC